MGWVLVKQDPRQGTPNTLQTQAVIGGPQGGLLISPDRPISPQDAGMQAANQVLSGRRGFSPEQTQRVAGTASRAAQLAGRYGGLAAMLGAGVKNLYDQTASGEPLSMSGLGSSMYGAQQFARPLATRGGATLGAKVGVRGAQREARDARAAQRTGSPASADFSMPQGTDMSMFNMAQPTVAQPTPLEQVGLDGIDPTMLSGDTRAYGAQGVPNTSMFEFRQQMPSFSPPLRQTTFSEFPAQPTPPAPQGMEEKLQSALPNPVETIKEQQAKQMEEQKERQEKQQEMQEEQRQKFAEEMRNRQDEQSTGV